MQKEKVKKEIETIEKIEFANNATEKDELIELYYRLKELGISRISDLENKIAACK